MSAPQSDMEKTAERYITSRADFELMKSQTYLREYYLDIKDLQKAVNHRDRYEEETDGFRNMRDSWIPAGRLKDAIDTLIETGYPFFLEEEAAEDMLRFLDSNPEDMIRALNRSMSQWAYSPGDKHNVDFYVPEFIVKNAKRYAREIGSLDLSSDSGKLVHISGTLLYLSDPVEIEFVKMAYLYQECSGYTVTDGEKPRTCDHCGSRKQKFAPDSELTITRNFHEVILQENVEDLAGSAASVRMHYFGSLINQLTFGDRITASGLVRGVKIPMKATMTYLIEVLSASKSDEKSIAITEKDQEEIMKMSRDPDVLDRLAVMLAS